MKRYQAKKNVKFKTAGLNAENCNRVYHLHHENYKSWSPAGTLNAIEKAEKGQVYAMDLKAEVNLSKHFKALD